MIARVTSLLCTLILTTFLESAVAMPAANMAFNVVEKRGIPVPYFDKDLPHADERHKRFLTAWPQVIVLAKFVDQKPDPEKWNRAFANYFDLQDRDYVERVFRLIIGADEDGLGNEVFGKVFLYNQPNLKNNDCESSEGVDIAWIRPVESQGTWAMKICDKGWEYPLLGALDCNDLGDRVSGKMASFPGLILHELMHMDPIGKEGTGLHVRDYSSKLNGFDGYGPLQTRKLKNNKNIVTRTNADQFRWFAQEYYYSVVCNKNFGPPRNNNASPL